jgi:hypothetical protein
MLNFYDCREALVLITTGRHPNETRSPRSILPKWIPNSIKVLGSYLGSDKANILINGDRYLEEHFQQYSNGSCAPLLTATDNASMASMDESSLSKAKSSMAKATGSQNNHKNAAVTVYPFAAARVSYSGIGFTSSEGGGACVPVKSSASWVDLGPRSPPALTLLFEGFEERNRQRHPIYRIVKGVLKLSLYGSSVVLSSRGQRKPQLITIVYQNVLPMVRSDKSAPFSVSWVGSSSFCVPCNIGERIVPFVPSLGGLAKKDADNHLQRTCEDAYFNSLSKPVSTTPVGLDSYGNVALGCSQTDVFHDLSQVVSRRSKTGAPFLLASTESNRFERYDWGTDHSSTLALFDFL